MYLVNICFIRECNSASNSPFSPQLQPHIIWGRFRVFQATEGSAPVVVFLCCLFSVLPALRVNSDEPEH